MSSTSSCAIATSPSLTASGCASSSARLRTCHARRHVTMRATYRPTCLALPSTSPLPPYAARRGSPVMKPAPHHLPPGRRQADGQDVGTATRRHGAQDRRHDALQSVVLFDRPRREGVPRGRRPQPLVRSVRVARGPASSRPYRDQEGDGGAAAADIWAGRGARHGLPRARRAIWPAPARLRQLPHLRSGAPLAAWWAWSPSSKPSTHGGHCSPCVCHPSTCGGVLPVLRAETHDLSSTGRPTLSRRRRPSPATPYS